MKWKFESFTVALIKLMKFNTSWPTGGTVNVTHFTIFALDRLALKRLKACS